VTDTQDQIDVLSSIAPSDASKDQTTSPPSVARAKRRSGSLSAMLLPELQALAGSMGLSAGKLRKSDLIAAIESANRPVAAPPKTEASSTKATAGRRDQSKAEDGGTRNRSAVTASGAAAPTDAAPTEAAPTEAAPTDGSMQAPTDAPVRSGRTRRTASRAAGPAQPTLTDSVESADGTSSDSADSSSSDTRDRTAPDRAVSDRVDRQSDRGEGPRNRQNAERTSANRNSQARDSDNREAGNREGGNREAGNREAGNREAGNREGGNREAGTREAGTREGGNREAGNRNANGQGGTQNSRNNNRDAQSNNRDAQSNNRDAQSNNRSNQNGQGNNTQGNNSQGNNNSYAEDDDEFGASRRGRRFRDRRGRNRDRFDTSATGGRPDAEPTIADDDILVPVAGILDAVEDKNTWFIRTAGYFASPEDVYVANTHIRRYGLRRGDAVTGMVKQPRDGDRKEKFNPLVRLDSVNGVDPEQAKNRVEFTKLTPLYTQDRLRLETEQNILTTRIIDLVMPIGKGQRALVVSPPKAGKTSVLQAIANAISVNNPECHLMVVLVDERPEEVTDMQRSVKGEVIASTFDRRPQDHTMIAELSIERAKRLVEMGHDVVVLLDSITRLGRAYNLAAPASGRILSGGVDSTALYPPKRFLGAARNIEDGGSLTIIATALVETGSTMDTVIFEEFKGTGNAELILDRKIADKRVFPAIDVDKSGTRKEEILLGAEELAVVLKLRRVLHALDAQQGIELLLTQLKRSRTNIEFLMQIAKTTPGSDDR
jgi:transcription termination factor Rho